MLGDLGVSRKTAGDVISWWLCEAERGDALCILAVSRGACDHAALSPIPWGITCLKPRGEDVHGTGPSARTEMIAIIELRVLRADHGTQKALKLAKPATGQR